MTTEHIITTVDGISLAASEYQPEGEPRVVVVVSSGTGFARSFYRHLAAFLCARGAVVITYDFRGIAGSCTPELLVQADLPDWGIDLDAILAWARDHHPELPVVHIGHSAGAHVVAFSEQSRAIEKHLFVAGGAGTMWQHFVSRWPLEIYFWWVLGTFSLLRHGHLARFGGWSGSPLPAGVFRTWRRWSHRSRYYARDVEAWNAAHPVGPVGVIESWVFSDDGICTPRSAQTILDCFPRSETSVQLVRPADVGLARIGHDGAFRKESALWERWWASIEEVLPVA